SRQGGAAGAAQALVRARERVAGQDEGRRFGGERCLRPQAVPGGREARVGQIRSPARGAHPAHPGREVAAGFNYIGPAERKWSLAGPALPRRGMRMKAQYIKAMDALHRACLFLAGCCLVIITLIIPWGVFTRFVLNSASSWPEPLAVLLMI